VVRVLGGGGSFRLPDATISCRVAAASGFTGVVVVVVTIKSRSTSSVFEVLPYVQSDFLEHRGIKRLAGQEGVRLFHGNRRRMGDAGQARGSAPQRLTDKSRCRSSSGMRLLRAHAPFEPT
jgi:hypothetical protein